MKINSKEFDALLNIIDPLTYLHSDEYKARFNIPKYFIIKHINYLFNFNEQLIDITKEGYF